MKKLSNIVMVLNFIVGVGNICKFLYYAGHYYNYLWLNLFVGIFIIIIGIMNLKSK